MNLNFSDEQNLLREQIQKFCNSDYDFYDRENFIKTESGFDPEKWKLFADQGWLAMPFSSESGGFDFGPIELSILFEEFGKFLVLEPYLSNVVLSGYILDNSSFDKKNDYIEKLISGDEQISLAYMEQNRNYDFRNITCLLEGADTLSLNGTKNLVLNGSNADNYPCNSKS
jgi:alkylation response protein AidB-like acyl-CoA dehydrogenase